MTIYLTVLATIFLFLLILLFIPVKVEALYTDTLSQRTGSITVHFLFLHFLIWAPDKKNIEKKKESSTPQRSLSSFKETSSALFEVVRSFKKRFTINLFSIEITAGTGDAASTGIFTGTAYGVVYNILGLADRFFRLKRHYVVVNPDFNIPCFNIDFKGTFSLRIIHALMALSKILRILKSA